MFLLAYTPPSNIAQEIIEIKTSIFRRWGTPSAIALPPLVPLILYDSEPDSNTILQNVIRTGNSFSAGHYTISEGALFLEVDIGIKLPESVQHSFPQYPGFHLVSFEEGGPSLKTIISHLDGAPVLRWTTGEFTLFSLWLNTSQNEWWTCLHFEEMHEIKVRKGRKKEY